MGDIRRTNLKFPVTDLTNDNASNSNSIIRYFDPIRNDINKRTELIDMTDENNQGSYSNTPVIDLTRDNDQFLSNRVPVIDLTRDNDQFLSNRVPVIDLTRDNDPFLHSRVPVIVSRSYNDLFLNNRIPIIDLTDDDFQDIANKIQCIDLTEDEASNHSHTNQYPSSINDTHTDASKEFIDLIEDNNQDSFTDIPPIDLTKAKDIPKSGTPNIDMESVYIQDTTALSHRNDLTYGKEQNTSPCFSTTDTTNDEDQVTNRNISGVDLSFNKDYNHKPVSGWIENDNVFGHSSDVKMQNYEAMRFSNFPVILQETVAESNHRISTDNFCNDVVENNVLKCNETFNKNLMHAGTSRRMQQYYHQKERILPNALPTNNFGGKKFSPSRSEKSHQNTASDFMKPADHPVPLRHSLGRSTVSTSKNVPFEIAEDSEGRTRTLTVSSVIRRKKSKSSKDIVEKNLPNSSEPSVSRTKAVPFDTFKEFLLKFWSLIFYWIYKIIIQRFIEFYGK